MPDTDQTPTPLPADLDAFDFDAFAAGITRPYEVVPIAQDARLVQQLHDAEEALADLEQQEERAQAEGKSTTRRAASVEAPQVEAARERVNSLQEQVRGKLVFVRIEAETRAARKQALKDAKAAGGDVETYNTSLVSLTSRLHLTDPRDDPESTGRLLTTAQWTTLAEAVGATQWDKILDACTRLAQASVTPDFSQPASPSPGGDTSSKS